MRIRYSVDLAVQEDGLSRRAASRRFRVPASTAGRWCRQSGWNKLALALAKSEGGERHRAKGRVGSLYEGVLVPCRMSMKEAREWLAEQEHVLGTSKAWRPRREAKREPKGYSVDIRIRAVAAVLADMTRRAASLQFAVSTATIGRWLRRFRETGSVGPLAMGGDRRSGYAQSFAGTITGWMEVQPVITIVEIRQRLVEQGHAPSCGAT